MSPSMKARAMPEGVMPLTVDADCSDDELLDAVIGHWHDCLMASEERNSILESLGVSLPIAERLKFGLSDRTLGNRLPDRRWKTGLVLRSRLTELGILRSSGHEAFRGCVVVPVTDPNGAVVGVFGKRLDRSRATVWADGLPGGVFNAKEQNGSVIVTASIPAALAVIGAGHDSVVAPGRPKGFTAGDLRAIAGRHHELVVVNRGSEALATELRARGASVSIAAQDVDLATVLGSAPVPADALGALLADSRPLETPGPEATTDSAAAADRPRSTLVSSPEGRDEVFVHAGPRSWRIRGPGGRSNREGDLLRVALSVTDSDTGRFHLDTLDLYAARQRTSFLGSAATELRVDRDALATEMAEVIGAAEQRRDEATSKKVLSAPVMTDAERADAMELLQAPDLLDRLGTDLVAMGVVGEETNLVVCYLATISRMCERPFGVLVQSSSAAGKSTLTDAVCSLVPYEDLVSLSAITSQALYYVGGGDLSRKVLAVAEEAGAASASYALKLLVSEGHLSIASTGKDRSTGRLATSSYEIKGPVALVMTTTATDIDPELENRLVVLGVNEDTAQTQAIVDAQRQAATLDGLKARSSRDHLRQLHANAQRLLHPFPVVIPDVGAQFPATATRYRRDHAKLLSIISAVTLLHQHQREHKTIDVGGVTLTYLEATGDDVIVGLDLARRVLVRGADNLAPQTARLLEAVIGHTTACAEALSCRPTEVTVTRRELRELLGWSDVQVRRATDRLVALEYLVVAGGGRGRCRTYSYVADIGQVGHRSGPVGQRGGRTAYQAGPGETDQLVTLVGLDDAGITTGGNEDKEGKGTPARRRKVRR